MFNIMMTWQDIQNINWEATITAFLTSTVFVSVVGYLLTRVLKKIGLKSERTEKFAIQVAESTQDLLLNQKNLTETIHDVKNVTKEMIESDAELKEIYTQGTKIIAEKIDLITDLRDIIKKYSDEE